jgi:hypothetical protein
MPDTIYVMLHRLLCISTLFRVLDYIASPGIVIPLIVLMALIIYYMVSLTNSLRESNNDLKVNSDKIIFFY